MFILYLQMKIKALFLLFTFLLNSAVGVNCALHKDHDCCDEITEHHQNLTFQDLTDHKPPTVTQEDRCCQNSVNDLVLQAKLLPQPVKIFMPTPVTYIGFNYLPDFKVVQSDKVAHQLLIDERRRPPTQAIRISIQSFQI